MEEHYDVVECLIKHGADVRRELKLSYPLFFWAVKAGNIDVVQSLVQHTGVDIDKCDESGQTALRTAARKGHVSIVEYLIQLSREGRLLDVNQVDTKGYSALWQAADEGHLAVAVLLIENGGDVNKADNNGQTPLYRASRHGRTNMVELLIAHGAIANQADNSGMTPLYRAVQGGHLAVVEVLVGSGQADVNVVSGSVGNTKRIFGVGNVAVCGGSTPLHYACSQVRCVFIFKSQ